MLVKCYGAAVHGIGARVVTIEVNVSPGIRFLIVGLPDNAVKESHERISSSLGFCGKRLPRMQVVINMAPADVRKEGSAYDLPLAIGILAASGQIKADLCNDFMLMGELSLDGVLKPIRGVLPIALKAREEEFKGIILPRENAPEAAVVEGLDVYGMSQLTDVIQFFNGHSSLHPLNINIEDLLHADQESYGMDFSEVKGQESVKRALEIAAAEIGRAHV